MERWVEITFACLPLRSIARWDIPLDASPPYRAFCERVKSAADTHGTLNTYYLYNGRCTYHLTNRADRGMLEFRFEGTVFTDAEDRRTVRCELDSRLQHETCDWLSEPIVAWFRETVAHSVAVEFDRYIAVGDLEQTRLRIERLQAASDQAGGFLAMDL